MEQVIQDYCDSSTASDAEIVAAAEDGSLSILDLVKLLAGPLQATAEAPRRRGLELLSQVMHRCHEAVKKLPSEHAEHLAVFFCNRIHDVPCTDLALRCLAGLYDQRAPEVPSAADVTTLLFNDVPTQTLSQQAREDVFRILHQLLPSQAAAAGPAFVSGFIEACSGERDPRNLIHVFALYAALVHAIPEHAAKAEEMFDVVSCYFPITFQPPQADKHKITNQTLRDALHMCFGASSAMAPHAIPYLIEQSDTLGFTPQKLHPYDALQACMPLWPPSVLSEHAPTLWEALQVPILSYGDPVVVEAATTTVAILAQALASDHETDGGTALAVLIDPILTRCALELRSPASRVAECCAKLAAALAMQSSHCCTQVVNQLLPAVCSQLAEESCSDPVVLLTMLQQVLQAARQHNLGDVAAADLMPTLLQVSTKAATAATPAAVADIGCLVLAELLSTRGLLNEADAKEAVVQLSTAVQTDVSERAVALKLVADQASEVLLASGVLQQLLTSTVQNSKLAASLCTQLSVWEQCVQPLLAALRTDSAASAAEALGVACDVVVDARGSEAVVAAVAILKQQSVLEASTGLPALCQVLSNVAAAAKKADLQSEVDVLYEAICAPMQSTDCADGSLLVPALAAILPHTAQEPSFGSLLVQLAKDAGSPPGVQQAACSVLALMANRRPSVVRELQLHEPPADSSCTLAVLRVHSAVLRGLVLKGDASARGLASAVLSSASSELQGVGWPIDLFGHVMEPCNGMVEGLLWQQKFFCSLLSTLVNKTADSEGDTLAALLAVLGALAPHVPNRVMMNETKKMMPLVRSAVASTDSAQVQAMGIVLLLAIVKGTPTAVQSELPSLLPQVLLLMTTEGGISPAGRIAALGIVEALLLLPHQTTFPFKPQVLNATLKALDDPKYVVRKAAVKCRNKWTLNTVSA